MRKEVVEIDSHLYELSEAQATREETTLSEVIEAYLRSWIKPATVTLTWEEIYVVRAGDTLAKIAARFYGDPKKYTFIADHNDIRDPAMIRVRQQLRIPFAAHVPAERHALGRPFRFPLDREQTNYYKFGDLYASNTQWAGVPHPGVDFHQTRGANVYAIGEGTVIVNRKDPTGYGHYLMIEHLLTIDRPIYSLYAHLQPDEQAFRTPEVGTLIRGTNVVIGKEGATGYAGVPHVHFEIKKTRDLGLYPRLDWYNLHEYFYDPYTFIRNPNVLCLPV